MTNRPRAGFTLLELIILLLITAIAAVYSIPTYEQVSERNQLKGVTDIIYQDLQYAKSIAISENVTTYVSFVPGAPWCYSISLSSPCDCSQDRACAATTLKKQFTADPDSNINLSAAQFAGGVTFTAFNPRNGAAQDNNNRIRNGSVRLSTGAWNTGIIISVLGRVRVCANGLWGYAPCP